MRFLRRIEGVTLFIKVHSPKIRKSFNIKQLLLRIERSQLRWFGHIHRMLQEPLPKQALLAKANGRSPVGRPRWTNYIEDLGWNRSSFTQAKWWMWKTEVESSRTSLASRTHFEVLGLEALGSRKLPCPRLEDSTIFWTVEILLENARNLAENLQIPFLFSALGALA